MTARLRMTVVVAVMITAVAPARGLEIDAARHLLVRAGIGASWAEIMALRPLDHAAAVRRLLDAARVEPITPAPGFMNRPRPNWPAQFATRDEALRRDFNLARDAEAAELRAWWVREMLDTDSPLTERMTLFWHNHFTSSMDKVRAPDLLYRQNLTMRRLALGDFRALLRAMVRDPAMLHFLDGNLNRRNRLNENFAREFLELFTLGEGHYGERDIREAARAFSGWYVDQTNGEAAFDARRFDDGAKTILGRTGPWGADDVVEIVLARPRLAEYIVGRLWREFVSDQPDDAEIRRVAAIFRRDYSIRAAVEAILLSPAFVDPANRGALIKSPVDVMVGTARSLGLAIDDVYGLADDMRRLRQELFNPPNVRGWPGGVEWISTDTLLQRRNLIANLLSGHRARVPGPLREGEAPRVMALEPFAASHRALLDDRAALTGFVLALPPVERGADRPDPRGRLDALVFDPAFQVR